MESGPGGLYDPTRGNRQVVNRMPPHIERAVVSIRRRLAARATPQAHYSQVGAAQIRAELEALGYSPLRCPRTIERSWPVLGCVLPTLAVGTPHSRNEYPGPQARDSNQVHQVDVLGPRYLKGDSTRYYFLVCRDIFDQSVYIEFVSSRKMDVVLDFLVHAWQHLGLPEKVQFDNGHEASGSSAEPFCGFGHAARFLSQVIRLCLRLEIGR